MDTYIETWKAIAYSLARSERWCRYMARRPLDPLPVYKVGGIVRLDQVDLVAWLERQRCQSLGDARSPAPLARMPVSLAFNA